MHKKGNVISQWKYYFAGSYANISEDLLTFTEKKPAKDCSRNGDCKTRALTRKQKYKNNRG